MIKSYGSLLSCNFSEMKCLFGWNNLFFHAKKYGFTGKKIFSLQENFACRENETEKLFSCDYLTGRWRCWVPCSLTSTEASSYGSQNFQGAWILFVSLGCVQVKFIPVKFPTSFQVDSRKRKFIIALPKQSLFPLEFPVDKAEKATFLSFWTLLEGNLSELYTLLKEWMWFSQLFYWRHWLDFCPASYGNFGATQGVFCGKMEHCA